MAISDIQPAGIPRADVSKKTGNFNNILNNQKVQEDSLNIRQQENRQIKTPPVKTGTGSENNQIVEGKTSAANLKENQKITNPEGITLEPLTEINPDRNVIKSKDSEGVKKTEDFQINQINELNAEIARGAARRNITPVGKNAANQDNQLGGKINTIA